MYAPPGVDSDSSDAETVTPPPSPKHTERPQFSLKHFLPTSPRSFLPRRRSSRAKSVMEANASVSPVMLEPRPPTPPARKKGVTWGEDEVLGPRKTPKPPDSLQVDLVESPQQRSPADPPSGEGSSSRLQSDTGTSSVRNDVGDEVLVLLRQLVADNAARAEQDAAASTSVQPGLGKLEPLMTLPQPSHPSPNKSELDRKKPVIQPQPSVQAKPSAIVAPPSPAEKLKPARKRPSVDTSASVHTNSSSSAPKAPPPFRVSNPDPDPDPAHSSTSPMTAPPGQGAPPFDKPHGLNETYYYPKTPQISNPHQYYPQMDPHSPSSVLSPSMTWPVVYVNSTQPVVSPPHSAAPQAPWPAPQVQSQVRPQPQTAPPWPTYQAQQYAPAQISPQNQHTVYYSPPASAYPAQHPHSAYPYYQSFPPVPQPPPPTYPHPPALQPWQPFYSPYYPRPPDGRPNGDSPWTPLTNPWDGRRGSPQETEADKNDRRRQPGTYLEAEGLQLRDMQCKPEHAKSKRPEADAESQRYEIDRTESTKVKEKQEPRSVRDVKEQLDRTLSYPPVDEKPLKADALRPSRPDKSTSKDLSASKEVSDKDKSVQREDTQPMEATEEHRVLKTREAMRARGMTDEQIQAYESKRAKSGTAKASSPKKEKELSARDGEAIKSDTTADAALKAAPVDGGTTQAKDSKDKSRMPDEEQVQKMVAAMKAKGMPDDKIQAYLQKHGTGRTKEIKKSDEPASDPNHRQQDDSVKRDLRESLHEVNWRSKSDQEEERKWLKMVVSMRAKGASEDQIRAMEKKRSQQMASQTGASISEQDQRRDASKSRRQEAAEAPPDPRKLELPELRGESGEPEADLVTSQDDEERQWRKMAQALRAKGASEAQIKAMQKKRAQQLATGPRSPSQEADRFIKISKNSAEPKSEGSADAKDKGPLKHQPESGDDTKGPNTAQDDEERKWRKTVESMRAKDASDEQIKAMGKKRAQQLASEASSSRRNATNPEDPKDTMKSETSAVDKGKGKSRDLADERNDRPDGASKEDDEVMGKLRKALQAKGMPEDEIERYLKKQPNSSSSGIRLPAVSARASGEHEYRHQKAREMMRAKGMTDEEIQNYERPGSPRQTRDMEQPEAGLFRSEGDRKGKMGADPPSPATPAISENEAKVKLSQEDREQAKRRAAMRAKGLSEYQIKAYEQKHSVARRDPKEIPRKVSARTSDADRPGQEGDPDLLARAAEKAQVDRKQGDIFVDGERSLRMPGQYVTPDAPGPSAVFPAEQKTNKPEGPLTWSRCLVSLATCIDLANQVLADYMTSDKSKRHSQQSSVLLTALPRLLTSLLLQRDLVAGMSSILGDEHVGALRDFMQHLGVVQSFLKEAQAGKTQALEQTGAGGVRDLTSEATSAFQSGSLQALFGHLLGLSELLTPNMMAAARDFIASWHKDGLSVALVVRTIRTVKHELDQVHSEKEAKASEDEGQKRLAQKSEGVMSILDQLLALVAPNQRPTEASEATPPPAAHSESSRPDGKEKRLMLPIVVSVAPDSKRPNGEERYRERQAERDRGLSEKRGRRTSEGVDKLRHEVQSAIHPRDRLKAVSTTPPSSPPSKRQVSPPIIDSRRPELELHLPRTTEDFLHSQPAKHPAHHEWSPLRPQRNSSVKSTNQAKADGLDDRRLSDSSASVYSQDSAHKTPDSDSGSVSSGTAKSDEEATELLAQADSGPQSVYVEGGEKAHRKRRPSREEVWAAEDLMGRAKPHKIR